MKDNMKRAPFSTQIDLSKFDMKDFAKASDEEKRQQEVMGESTTFLKDGLKRLRKNPLAMGSIIVWFYLFWLFFWHQRLCLTAMQISLRVHRT